ncbi:MAG TPA: tyrosine-protein phosphatase [Acidiphilium sp.]
MTALKDRPVRLLSGAANFRAIPALPTEDGRSLRPGLIYRSGELSGLTRDDLTRLESLGIKLVCDLRSRAERRRFPTAWPALAPARIIEMPPASDAESGMNWLIGRLAQEPGAVGARRAMTDLYATLPRLLLPILAETFAAVAAGWALPVLLHCHVGKDRTGVAAAILLRAAGITRDGILADYLETTRHIDGEADRAALGRTVGRLLGRAIDPDTLDILSRADEAYLDAAFAAIDRNRGGFDAWLSAAGVTPDHRARLRSLLTVPA